MSRSFDPHATLRKQIQRSLSYLHAVILKTGYDVPSAEDRRHIMHLLRMTQRYPQLWPDVRLVILAIAVKMEQAGHRREWIALLEHWQRFSQKEGDVAANAELTLQLGRLHQLQGNFEEAASDFEQSARLFEQIQDQRGQARSMGRSAYIMRLIGHFCEAASIANAALRLLPAGDTEAASIYTVLATIADDRAEYNRAIALHQQAVALWRSSGNTRMLAWSLRDIGGMLDKVGKIEEAIEHLEEALALFDTFDDPIHQASARMNLATVYLEADHPAKALRIYQEVEPVFRKLSDARRLAIVYTNLGYAYHQLGKLPEAKNSLENAVIRWKALGDPNRKANAQGELEKVLKDYRQ